jgi:hypothetical protein
MSYLRDFGAKLEALLQDVEPEKRKEIIKLCKETVLESYRNGQKAPVTKKESSE